MSEKEGVYWLIPDWQVEWSNRGSETRDLSENHPSLIDPHQLKRKQVKFVCSLFPFVCVCVCARWGSEWTRINIINHHQGHCAFEYVQSDLPVLFTVPPGALIGGPANLAFWKGSKKRQAWRLTPRSEMWIECGSGKGWWILQVNSTSIRQYPDGASLALLARGKHITLPLDFASTLILFLITIHSVAM